MIEIAALPSSQPNTAKSGDLPGILLVIDQLDKTLGGGERIVFQIAKHLPHYGFMPYILTLSAHPESPALKSPPCPIYLLPLQRTFDLTAFCAALELRRFLNRRKIRIVNTFFASSDIWAGFVTKVFSRAKLVSARRDMGILRTKRQRIAYRVMADMPDAVFAVSEQVKQYSIDVDRVSSTRIQTIYNGLSLADWDMIPNQRKDPDESSVISVGNIRRVKGHDLFIMAAAAVVRQFPTVSFRILGDVLEPDYSEELDMLVRELNLSGNLRIESAMGNLREHFRRANLFVLPSRSEGFSNALLEAMACSLPVVATNVGGNAEAVQDGITGLLVPPESPEALATAIVRLISDRSKAKAMGESGRRLVAQRFTIEVMMEKIVRA